MRTKPFAFGLIILCTFLTSIAQILYKFGANKLVVSLYGIITNYQIITGLIIYVIAGIIMIIALRHGDVTVLYPIIATSYVWVSLLSIFFLGELMNAYKWIGIFIIIAGVILVSVGSKKDGISYTEVA
ncbi:EamA family transporter [Candidatus Woesearchaeota archaeon]|nr:EamA family transporter [Candidatus Woesearchaeota archaeon]